MNLNDVVSSPTVKKQRGRPRKNGSHTIKKNKTEQRNIVTYEKEIILHMPISLRDIGQENNINKFEVETETEKEKEDIQPFYSHSSISDLSEKSPENISDNTKLSIQQMTKLLGEKDKVIDGLKAKLGIFASDGNTPYEKVKICSINFKLKTNGDGTIIVPPKIDIACWWDTCLFDGEPYFIPERYYDKKFYVFGCFCSINCAAAYNLNMCDYKVTDRHSLLKWMYNIPPSYEIYIPNHPVPILDKFGGSLTIENYRKNNYLHEKEYRILIPPMVAIISHIEERSQKKQNKCINVTSTDRFTFTPAHN